ncbi:hypothetical protein H0H92_001298 [Tricholoma furcatifolium]|nr:hypothetical protein H0H92_001298 [Tricholoma furcatifolium]
MEAGIQRLREQVELLNQLDGFEATKNLKVKVTMNQIDIFNSIPLRPGRIDHKIKLPSPGRPVYPFNTEPSSAHSQKRVDVPVQKHGVSLPKLACMLSQGAGDTSRRTTLRSPWRRFV